MQKAGFRMGCIGHQDVREARRAQDAISSHAAQLFTALGGKSDLSRRWFSRRSGRLTKHRNHRAEHTEGL